MVQFNTQSVTTGNIFDGPTEIHVDGNFIGATVGGVELMHTQETGEKVADQTPLLLGSYLKSGRGGLKFELEDLSFANLSFVFGNPSSATGGGNKSIQATKTVVFVGNGPNGGTRTFTINNARFKGSTTGKFHLGESVAFTVELIMEADQSQPDGQHYFSVVDG